MKSLFTKLLVLTLISLTMSACSTMQSHFRPNSVTVVTPPEIQYPTIALQEVAIDAPDLTIRERTIPLNPALHEKARIAMTPAEIKCMADVIYLEARSEDYVGRVAVGYVVLNRIADGRFRNTVCGTVYQKDRGRCQFSWCKTTPTVKYPQLYAEARDIAIKVMRREVDNPIGNHLFFHATSVNKSKRYVNENRIGGHRFYGAVTSI
ncbi:cell wall hydrolase [Stenotrophomonas sp. GD03657]|uniref:cell wall hydrolase n=1 Tax=Stenotrophomonas sp. GD03657 TaxID=2975363 RepID=UPI00244A3F21|nr:cell wall hydrolase [Stenotrophomonas sp. GD03657]MDH2154191.1 cell wall hydrolase [Stenotrophomonas sp. GD03657]